jgi:hypothetical protein
MIATTTGIVKEILNENSGKKRDGGEWTRADVLLETSGGSLNAKPYQLLISFFSMDGPIVNLPKVGEKISITVSINASNYNGRWYNKVNAMNYEVIPPEVNVM